MVTMTLRSPLALLGALPGAVLALTAALAALLRRDKPLHPVGHHGTGHLTVIDPAPTLGIEAISRVGTRSCQARWSRAMGLPQGWPDIEGLALRLHDAGVDGDDADVLFASTGSRPWNRYLLVLRGPRRFGRLTTLLPVRARSRAVTFRLSPSGDTRDGLPPTRYEFDLALGTDGWQPVGVLDVVWSLTDSYDRFDPITRPLAGIDQYALVEALREPAYVAARTVARARHTDERRHHA